MQYKCLYMYLYRKLHDIVCIPENKVLLCINVTVCTCTCTCRFFVIIKYLKTHNFTNGYTPKLYKEDSLEASTIHKS